jgi:hypothetical protein
MTSDPICYLLALVDEPQEDPIALTQADFDQLILVGKQQPEDDAPRVIEFATLTTVEPHDNFLCEGEPIDPDEASTYCARAIVYLLREAVRRAEENSTLA